MTAQHGPQIANESDGTEEPLSVAEYMLVDTVDASNLSEEFTSDDGFTVTYEKAGATVALTVSWEDPMDKDLDIALGVWADTQGALRVTQVLDDSWTVLEQEMPVDSAYTVTALMAASAGALACMLA